jgi:hypothetical protein
MNILKLLNVELHTCTYRNSVGLHRFGKEALMAPEIDVKVKNAELVKMYGIKNAP